jgi:hypothetical protein
MLEEPFLIGLERGPGREGAGEETTSLLVQGHSQHSHVGGSSGLRGWAGHGERHLRGRLLQGP